jgi:hypothetical protein
MQRLKGGSSVIANREGHVELDQLKWSKGYNIQSVSVGAVDRIAAYVRNQPSHHPAEAIAGRISRTAEGPRVASGDS